MSLEKKYQVQEDEYYELLFEAFEEIVKKQTKQIHFFIVAKFRCSISLSKLINKLVRRGQWLSSQNFPTQLLLTPIFQQHHDSELLNKAYFVLSFLRTWKSYDDADTLW